MKNFYCSFIVFAILNLLTSCSAEDAIADEKSAGTTDKVLQQRMKIIMAMDFTTLYTYTTTVEAQNKLPHAIDSLVNIQKQTMHAHKGATDAIVKIIVEDGKAVIWEMHFIDAPNKRLTGHIQKKAYSHVMYSDSRDNYPVVYNEITEAMENRYSNLGSLADSKTTLAINNYLSKRLTIQNRAEYRIRITDSSAEVYALR